MHEPKRTPVRRGGQLMRKRRFETDPAGSAARRSFLQSAALGGLVAGSGGLVALAGAYASVPRALAVDFSKNVMWFGISALVRKADEKKWKTIEDADQPGIRFIQAEGTAIQKQLSQTLKKAKLVSTAPGTQSTNMALEVLSNRADVYVEDDWLVKKNVEQHKGRLIEMPAYADKPWNLSAVSWAVAKGQSSMLNVLNVAIDRMTDNNKFQQWDEKYGAHW